MKEIDLIELVSNISSYTTNMGEDMSESDWKAVSDNIRNFVNSAIRSVGIDAFTVAKNQIVGENRDMYITMKELDEIIAKHQLESVEK